MQPLERIAERLCTLSRRGVVPVHAALPWPERLEREQWFVSPELISLYGTDAYASLDPAARQRLSFWEAVNFFSLNVHGERALVEGIARRLHRPEHVQVSNYLHHFLDEENKHMAYFAGFCTRYAGKLYPERKLVFPRDYAPGEEDFLFFAKVMLFEEIVDAYNQRMARDERLLPLVREINRLHHLDEVRHLAFGRALVADLFARSAPGWSAETLAGVRAYLVEYLNRTLAEYHNPDVYRDAGLSEPLRLRETGWDAEAARERRSALSAACVRFLRHEGILAEEPAP